MVEKLPENEDGLSSRLEKLQKGVLVHRIFVPSNLVVAS